MGKRMEEAIARYQEIQQKNLLGGGIEHIERQHKRGKLTARERIDVLVDPGTFNEMGSSVGATGARVDGRVPVAPCDGAVVGTGKVHGRVVAIYASDFTVLGGSTATQHLHKYMEVLELAARMGIPIVNLLDSSGGRLGHTDVVSAGVDWHFRMESLFSGVIPQITVLMGPCIAGGAYLPTLCDFLLMSRVSANMWLGGPRQTAAATSEKIDRNVGGADYHMQYSGSADMVGDDDEISIKQCRELIRYLPQNYREKPPNWQQTDDPLRSTEELMELIPDDFSEAYDMHDVIKVLVDDGDYLEIKDEYAKNLITCFARFDGEVVGICCQQSQVPGKHPGDQLLRQVLPLPPGPRRLQHPPRQPDGHAAIGAGRGSGGRWPAETHGEDRGCLRHGYRAQDQRGAAGGVRRRRGDDHGRPQEHGRRPDLCLAHRRVRVEASNRRLRRCTARASKTTHTRHTGPLARERRTSST